jgi:hypothetical protein
MDDNVDAQRARSILYGISLAMGDRKFWRSLAMVGAEACGVVTPQVVLQECPAPGAFLQMLYAN